MEQRKNFLKPFVALYRIRSGLVRNRILSLITKFEKSEFYSLTLRDLFRSYHHVSVGLYSYGGCFVPGFIHEEVTIGRYCSFGRNVYVLTRNHPYTWPSHHPFFFNRVAEIVDKDACDSRIPTEIGSDVWMGNSSIVIPSVRSIGHGAIVGAGSVVTKDVPPYAIVAGNPARIIKYRFSTAIVDRLLESAWWEKSIDELCQYIELFQHPVTGELFNHPVFQGKKS